MKQKGIAISLTLACCIAFAVAAQAPSAETKGQGKDVTLSGCLQAGTEPNTFTLKNVTYTQAAGSETTPPELAKVDTEYRLAAAANVNLKNHVGHKVEVTGMFTGHKTDKPEHAKPAETERDKPAVTERASLSQFKVKSLKHISPSCP